MGNPDSPFSSGDMNSGQSAESLASTTSLLSLDTDEEAEDDAESDAPADFLDPITFRVMQRPVTLLETGHTYELGSIQEWFARGNHTCPMTNIVLKNKVAQANTELLANISSWRSTISTGARVHAPDQLRSCQQQQAKQLYHFRDETYWSPPSLSDRERADNEVHEAYGQSIALLGERLASQLVAAVIPSTGFWLHQHSAQPVECYVAGQTAEFGDNGARCLAQLLRPRPNPDGTWSTNRPLSSLGLPWNNIGPSGAEAIAQALQPHVQADGTRAFSHTLKALSFRRNLIGDSGIAALADIFAPRLSSTGDWTYCTAVTSLDVSCCGVGEGGAKALAQALTPGHNHTDGSWVWPPLQSLNLYGNPELTSLGVASLVEALLSPVQDATGEWVYNPRLSRLSIDVSNVSDMVLKAIGDAMAPRWSLATQRWIFNTTLSKLELSNSIPIRNISGNFALKSRIKSALREPRSRLNACRKQVGVHQAGGMLELLL